MLLICLEPRAIQKFIYIKHSHYVHIAFLCIFLSTRFETNAKEICSRCQNDKVFQSSERSRGIGLGSKRKKQTTKFVKEAKVIKEQVFA